MSKKTKTPPVDERAKDQAKAQFESIQDMVKALEAEADARADGESESEDAQHAIQDDPLSIEVRSGWHTPGETAPNEEYTILLCTGGPACRIIGGLSDNEPDSARIEYQDWGTPWTEYRLDSEQEETVLTYVRQFYFGE